MKFNLCLGDEGSAVSIETVKTKVHVKFKVKTIIDKGLGLQVTLLRYFKPFQQQGLQLDSNSI